MIAPLKKVSCRVWSYRGAVLSCASPIPKYLLLGVIYWPSDYESYFSSSAICLHCTSYLYPLCEPYLCIYYLDSYLQIYRDGTLWSNLALTGGNSRHRKRLRKKRCEVDLPWRMVFPGISQMFNYDDVGSCDFSIFAFVFLWWSILIVHEQLASIWFYLYR